MIKLDSLQITCFFLILVLLIPFSLAYADDLIVKNIQCPERLTVGDRKNISFYLENSQEQDVLVRDINLIMDNSIVNFNNQIKFHVEQVPESFTLTHTSAKKIVGTINFPTQGIHFVDLEMKVSMLNNPEETIQKEICRVEVLSFEKEQNPIILTMIISIITTSFGGAAAYGIKRYFVNKDTEKAKTIDHQHWRMEKMHNMALKYYFPLAKDSWEVEKRIALANQSGNNVDIRAAFDKLNEFLKRYDSFKKESGATFLFVVYEYEQIAINKMQSILISLPYDDTELDFITKYLEIEKPTAAQTTRFNESFTHFSTWMSSIHCNKSRRLILSRLTEFGKILDKQAEIISHPKFIDKKHDLPEQKNNGAKFWILYSSSKYVHNKDTISVYGRGFNESDVNYTFYMGSYELEIVKKQDNFIELQVPEDIEIGTYDLSAGFQIEEEIDLTIGIVIHVIK